MSDAKTITRRTWFNPRNQARTVPEAYGFVACIDVGDRLLVILDGPRDADGQSHKVEIEVDGSDTTLAGHLIDSQTDRNGCVLIAEFGPAQELGDVAMISLRIDDNEVLRVAAIVSRTLI